MFFVEIIVLVTLLLIIQEATLYEAATEIRFLDNVIKEVMRVYPVAPRYFIAEYIPS